MEYFFAAVKSIVDGVGMAIFLLLAVFVFALSMTMQFIRSQIQFKEQQKKLKELYGRAPQHPITPQQEKDAKGEGASAGIGDQAPVDYFNDLSKK